MQVLIEHSKGYTNIKQFQDNPYSFSINQCHNKAEGIGKKLEQAEIELNIENYRAHATFYRGCFYNKGITEQVQIIDVKTIES